MKKLIVIFLMVLFYAFTSHVKAQGDQPPVPEKPVEGSYIFDTLNWLDDGQEQRITSIASSLDEEGLAELYVVTRDDCGTDKTDYRKLLFNTWEIGHPDQDGLLILVCWYGGDKAHRSVEQEFGGGLENILSSSITDQVVKDQFVPKFDQGSPGEGLIAMTESYQSMIRSESVSPTATKKGSRFSEDLWFVLAIVVVIGAYIYNSRKNLGEGKNLDDRFHGGGYYGGDSSGDGGGSSTGF